MEPLTRVYIHEAAGHLFDRTSRHKSPGAKVAFASTLSCTDTYIHPRVSTRSIRRAVLESNDHLSVRTRNFLSIRGPVIRRTLATARFLRKNRPRFYLLPLNFPYIILFISFFLFFRGIWGNFVFKKRKGKEIYLSFLVSRGTVMIMFRLKFYLYLFLRRNTIKVRKSLRIYSDRKNMDDRKWPRVYWI